MFLLFSMEHLVKKICLKTMQSNTKIFREVNALSRLSHRNIVRYYTTWVETSDPQSTVASDDSSASLKMVGLLYLRQVNGIFLLMEGFISTLKILMIFLCQDVHFLVFILEGRVHQGRLERILVKMMGLAVCLDQLLRGRFLLLRLHLHF